jgi:hypothetical protein
VACMDEVGKHRPTHNLMCSTTTDIDQATFDLRSPVCRTKALAIVGNSRRWFTGDRVDHEQLVSLAVGTARPTARPSLFPRRTLPQM